MRFARKIELHMKFSYRNILQVKKEIRGARTELRTGFGSIRSISELRSELRIASVRAPDQSEDNPEQVLRSDAGPEFGGS